MYDTVKIAQKIKETAKSKNVVLKNMLEECGMNKNAISTMISRGSIPQADNLAKIADYLDVSVDYLLGRTEEPNGYSNNKNSFNNSGSNNNQNIGNGNIITTNTPDNKQTDIYSDLIEHLEALSKSEKLRAVADMTDLLEEKYPVKKK